MSVYFNFRNILPKSGTFLPAHSVYIYIDLFIIIKQSIFHTITGYGDPEEYYKYNSTLSLTSALDGGG
jgi:hypothetical protein